jgi:hypothetical protein
VGLGNETDHAEIGLPFRSYASGHAIR